MLSAEITTIGAARTTPCHDSCKVSAAEQLLQTAAQLVLLCLSPLQHTHGLAVWDHEQSLLRRIASLLG